jgi:GDSL-like Lipase/Acylhydrolase.
MNNTDGYSKLLVSGIFVMVFFLVIGALTLSSNKKTEAVQAIMMSGKLGVMSKYRIFPCNILNSNNNTINIDFPDFLIEPEPEPEPEPEIEVAVTHENLIKIPEIDHEIVYVGRIPYDYSICVPECEPVGDDYFSDALFIGDSRTVGLANYGGIQSYFYAKVALTIRGVLTTAFIEDTNSGETVTRTIMDTVTQYPQFKKIYIAFGLNELGWDSDIFINTFEYIIDQFQEIIPDVQIFIQEIIPVTKSVSDAGKNHVRMSTINEYNALLLELANKKQVFYLGVGEIFTDEYGYLQEGASWDGLHLNIDSCKKQMEYIRNHVVDYKTTYLRPNEEPVTTIVPTEE